jgi:hypothetical protein
MITRFSAELATAAVTAGLGLTVIVGALEFGIGWDASGPAGGAFPFYVGILVVAASIGTMVQAVLGRGALQVVIVDREQAYRVASFFAPVVLFVVASLFLGLYVASALYLALVMWLQGGYRPIVAAATGVAASVIFYVVLELLFKVPLLKGPLEAALGLY